MLSTVRFQNIRALADFKLDLSPLTVLVGPNACGKSTVLDEIELLCKMSHPDPEGVNVAAGPGRVLTEVGVPPATNGMDGDSLWSGVWSDVQFSVKVRRGSGNRFDDIIVNAGDTIFSTKDSGMVKDFNHDLMNFSWRAQRLSLERRLILAPSPVDAPLNQLDPSGYGLATLLLHLAANETAAYLALQQDLTAVVPDFRRLHVVQVQQGGQTQYAMELTFQGAGRIPAQYASEGTLFALGLLAAIHAPTTPSVVLLDDLDRGLHLSAQFQLIKAIRAVQARQPHLQVICTSHSPVLVDSFAPAEVRVMALDTHGHAKACPLTKLPDFDRWSRAMQSGELWANFGEQWVAQDVP